jgi:hypothetical protein
VPGSVGKFVSIEGPAKRVDFGEDVGGSCSVVFLRKPSSVEFQPASGDADGFILEGLGLVAGQRHTVPCGDYQVRALNIIGTGSRNGVAVHIAGDETLDLPYSEFILP